ncbi:glycerol kinase GlpK [Kordiimonas marina]|uniref:glycerol kinase GlpK n=1 Tax=Kordiimonas marina TaxID=2872312 RepID=UPI001FF2FD43|nr:glycerol kinase GlpK [Kordiimonas marina]MCJ9428886.1 glycerol kinase GlpK [Kordiimonas marina]
MADTGYILALDQGTTSTRALAFNAEHKVLAVAQRELKQYYPANGWVEHDAAEIWDASLAVMAEVIGAMEARGMTPMALGITNQRETTILWDRRTGEPVHRAIVWQDRRTADVCDDLRKEAGVTARITRQTGLLLDPYFSATKIAWILDNNPDLRALATAGDLAFGTVESYLLYRLTGGIRHATDATNASRTMLCDIRTCTWSEELLDLTRVPKALMPEIVDNAGAFGVVDEGLPGAGIPITGLIGDQQSAAVGQACIAPGQVKSTYGTGCFVLQNTGEELVYSQNRMLSTVAYRIGGKTAYAMEGSIFNAGTVVQWFRDQLGLIQSAPDSEALVAGLSDSGGVYMVPAFTGLGAPHWRADARGMLSGLTRDTSAAHIVRAGLESVVYQTADLFAALKADGAQPAEIVRVDGGMAANGWFVQYLADICDVPVERPVSVETTALGAALCAGVGIGLWPDLEAATAQWQLDAHYDPAMEAGHRAGLLKGWQAALRQCLA